MIGEPIMSMHVFLHPSFGVKISPPSLTFNRSTSKVNASAEEGKIALRVERA
jgi:hypothetical protein